MDKKEEPKEVSLPGAGATEPTILEVLNRSIIGECDNEATAQQPQEQLQQELQQSDDDHRTDEISYNEINDNFQLDIHYAATTQVTDLDVDDNEHGNERVLELQSDSITADSAVASQPGDQVISESESGVDTQVKSTVPISCVGIESVACDIGPFDSITLSGSNKTFNLKDERRLPVADNSAKRLSAVEEQSNESESSYSDDNSKITVVCEPKESDKPKPWYQDDDLDPEDQKIIQEAIESILKEAKEQYIEEQGNRNKVVETPKPEEAVIQDISPLQAPLLILSNPLLNTPDKDKNKSVDQADTSHHYPRSEIPTSDSGIISPYNDTTHSPLDTSNSDANLSIDPESSKSLLNTSSTLTNSPDSGITSPILRSEALNTAISSEDQVIEADPIVKASETPEIDSNTTTEKQLQLPTSDDIPQETADHLKSVDEQVEIKQVEQQITDNLKSVDGHIEIKQVEQDKKDADNDLPFLHQANETINHTDFLTAVNDWKKQFSEPDAANLSSEAKKEYYRHLRDYLNNQESNRPPVPLKTYQWEDLRRAKKQGGYPWTHLYKRPLGPDEEPELLTLRRSQERQKFSSESPRSAKKVVRIHDEVLVKETERYICDLSENETDEEKEDDRPEDQREEDDSHLQEPINRQLLVEDNFSVQSEPILSVSSDSKASKITRIKGILKRRLSLKHLKSGSAPESRAEETTPVAQRRQFLGTQQIAKCCHPIMNKLKSMADKQLKRRHIKKVPLKDDEKIVLGEKQKILKLKQSPKAEHSQIPHFIEKQDSDDVLEILELEESPSKARKLRLREDELIGSSIVIPDEIIELPSSPSKDEKDSCRTEASGDEPASIAKKSDLRLNLALAEERVPSKRKEHIYEDIEGKGIEDEIDDILQEAVESATRLVERIEEEKLKLSPERDIPSEGGETIELRIVEEDEKEDNSERKSALKRESSPVSDKHVTFSHTEDDADPHREDIELPEGYGAPKRLSDSSEHEYEPIGQPLDESQSQAQDAAEKEPSPIPIFRISEPPAEKASPPIDNSINELHVGDGEEHEPSAYEQQREIEERYFSSVPTTPRTDSRTDYEIHTSQVDSSAIEELPLKPENRKKGFMASAHDRSRRVSQNLRTQAGKIKTRIRGTKKPVSGSPKTKERKRFKKPDFSKIKMPEIKRPELPKFKTPEMPKFKSPEFKRPEFTKFERPIFTKPDLSKFKIPDTMTFKLRRTRSLKEREPATSAVEVSPESVATPKKRFDFNFGTYPRMLKKRRQKLSTVVVAKVDDLPSTETPQSVESTKISRQEGGPVSLRWTEKISDVSYGDSESGKYQRYGSEVESLGRESSLERRMKEDLERSSREQEELEMMHTVDQKQFADYDEENRAIHEISKIREKEFKKRRPIVHQDSDLVSEESKDVGWSEKDAIRNALLKGEEEPNAEYVQQSEYPSDERLGGSAINTNHETQSTASSGARQKGVIEEIDDDEFVLRKRGISQDNIEIRQYISTAIREGLTTPINTLAQVGNNDSYFPDLDVSNEQVNYGYDVPPPKPKRAPKHLNNFDMNRDTESREISQEYDGRRRDSFDDNTSLPHEPEDYFTNIPPSRPTRKSRKHYYQEDEHEVPLENLPYLDDEEDNLLFKKINIESYHERQEQEDEDAEPVEQLKPATPPKVPKRRKKQPGSAEKDSYANRFSGRSVSNSFLPSEERDEDFIVYRTQHEYIIPLAQPETFSTPTPVPRRSRSRSQSRITDDDRTSRGAESLVSETLPVVEEKFHIDIKENDGYATVRKDPPPRPPAPNRQRKPSPLPSRFATMPHARKESSRTEQSDIHFNTIGPSRPPRRKSSASFGDSQKNVSSPDVTQYEELDIGEEENNHNHEGRIESPRGDLHSGDVINKMKFRPLPPPPRPPREIRRKDRKDRKEYFDDDDKQDGDGGAEKVVCDLQLNGDYDVEKHTDKCIEVEVSTQTDPLPDDFCCEEFEITDDMRVIEPRVGRTLADILKYEQEHISQPEPDEDSLTKSLQRFREASQRSFSERSRGSADRSRASHGSRPTTPSAIILERRVPTPIPNRQGETMLEASLLVCPVDDLEFENEDQDAAEQTKTDDEFCTKDDEISPRESRQEEEKRLILDQLEQQYLRENSVDQGDEQFTKETTPPIAPPRKRSSITGEVQQLTEDNQQIAPVKTLSVTAEEPHHGPVERLVQLRSRLALADLEVERLSVGELQAGSITVSQLQSSLVKTDELECTSSNLQQPLEIPAGLIEEIIRRVRNSERTLESTETQTTEQPLESHAPEIALSNADTCPPPRPPLPQSELQDSRPLPFPAEYMQYSIPPASFYALRDPSEAELHPSPSHRRRRHHRRKDSSTEDESHREHRRSRHSTRSPEPSIGQLGGQLLGACGSSLMQSMNHIVNILRANEKEGNDRNISTAIVLVIIVTIGFLLLGISGNRNIHHHHWDYFNPPDNKGR